MKLRYVLFGLAAIALFGCVAIALLPQQQNHQMSSFYIEMPDGTEIGVRLFLPTAVDNGEKVPAILEMTRYGSAYKFKMPIGLFLKLLRVDLTDLPTNYEHDFLDAGYAYVKIDVRGTGISGGDRIIEWPDKEIEDMYHIINWIVNNEWSNGLVGTLGISYLGNTAELAASVGHKALFAIAPMYSDFNPFKYLGMPGGIHNDALVKYWGDSNESFDSDSDKIITMLPVDGQDGKKKYKDILKNRRLNNVYELTKGIKYFDEVIIDHYTPEGFALYQKKEAIEASNVPYYIRVGWQDAATVNGVFERYNTFSNPMEIYIGPWNHAGLQFYDPLRIDSSQHPESDLKSEQVKGLIDYFNKQMALRLGSKSLQQKESVIHYYTLGEGVWKKTTSWPLKNEVIETWHMNEDLTLSTALNKTGKIEYLVDFTATTGSTNRWLLNVKAGDIQYENRSKEDEKLICFTSEPFKQDRVITGNPVVALTLSSKRDEAAVYVYLEDVAPDGTVTYITEGQINAIHRKIDNNPSGYVPLPANHSYHKEDALEIVPGKPMDIDINLYATSAQIKKGHSVRICIAGHDASGFRRIPETGSQELSILIDSEDSNLIKIPFEL